MVRRILALPLLVFLAACQGTPKGGDWNQAIGKDWVLVGIDGGTMLRGSNIDLTFRGDRGIFGEASNRYVGRYKRNGPELKITEVVATHGFRDEPKGAMAQAKRYLELLNAIDGYTLLNAGQRLELSQGSRVTLAFESKAKPQ